MDSDMLEIHPRELTFLFELQKQSVDSVQLYNNSDQCVAFKVKTTSPKKYCVRPNIGIIKPKSTCTFTVTMQPQREAPPYLQCKDKFLIQSTIIPHGTKDDEITSDLFSKSSDKYIEEKKLRVVLISASPDVIPVNGDSKKVSPEKTLTQGDRAQSGLDKPISELIENGGEKYSAATVASVVEHNETAKATSEPMDVNKNNTPGEEIKEPPVETNNLEKTVEAEMLKETVDASYLQATVETNNARTESSQERESGEVKSLRSNPHQSVESFPNGFSDMSLKEDLKVGPGVTEAEHTIKDKETGQNLKEDVEALELKIENLNMQLNKAKYTIAKLGEEQNKVTKEKEMIKQELAMLRQGTDEHTGQLYDGFPLLFVCVVALVSLACGYLLRP